MDENFAAEVERLRAASVPGASGRLRELFDYLAERGPSGDPATQGQIASAVFGQDETFADDATVRVYVHRLRKRLEDHYLSRPPAEGQARLEIPAGIYALRMQAADGADGQAADGQADAHEERRRGRTRRGAIAAMGALGVAAAFAGGLGLGRRAPAPNALWREVVGSQRPILVVLGNYYMFGEIDPVRPDEGRLIRDFRVHGPQDLLRLQEAEPQRYGAGEDFGLSYLPVSSAQGLARIAPLLEAHGKSVNILLSSELEPDMLNYFDIVYIGLLSGLALLEDRTFAGSGFRLGESYDELIDRTTGERYVSDEARSLASPAFYRDYAYITRFPTPGGAQITIIASQRDTGLRGISPLVSAPQLPGLLHEAINPGQPFEALFQITGQKGAGLSHRLILARPRE